MFLPVTEIRSESTQLCVREDSVCVCLYVGVQNGQQLVPISVSSRLSGEGVCGGRDMTSSRQVVRRKHLQTAHRGVSALTQEEGGTAALNYIKTSFYVTGSHWRHIQLMDFAVHLVKTLCTFNTSNCSLMHYQRERCTQ